MKTKVIIRFNLVVLCCISLISIHSCRNAALKEKVDDPAKDSIVKTKEEGSYAHKNLPIDRDTSQGEAFTAITLDRVNISGVFLGDSISVLNRFFGKPDSIVQSINEFNGDTSQLYFFKESMFKILRGKFDGFDIADTENIFNPGEIKIGDGGEKLKQFFPAPYEERYALEDSIQVVKVSINNSNEFVLFKLKRGKVTNILTWVDW